MLVKEKERVVNEIGEFIWDGFCDPAGVGVNVAAVLDGASLVGVNLTNEQKNGVLTHGDDFGEWNASDEGVRDLIADATDCEDYEKMFSWLAFVVGDTTAEALVEDWELEAQDKK